MTTSTILQSDRASTALTDPRERLHHLVNLMTESATECLNGGHGSNRVLFVIGHVGTALNEAFTKTALFREASQHGRGNLALLTVEVPAHCAAKDLVIRVLESFGGAVSRKITECEMFELLSHALREREVLFLHLEDSHNLTSYETERERRGVEDLIKALLSIPNWPLHIILSGQAD